MSAGRAARRPRALRNCSSAKSNAQPTADEGEESGTYMVRVARAAPFHPQPGRDAFRDILVFEERLKQNAERLQKQRRKYEAFLLSLVAIILYLAYTVFIIPSIYSLVHYGNVAFLLVSLMTLVLFFATGMYSEKITYAYKFVPQANRALRPFNIYLNTRTRARFPFLASLFRSSPPAAVAATTPPPNANANANANANTPPLSSAPLSRRTSSSSSHSSASSVRSSRGNRSPPGSPVSRSPGPSPPPPRGVPLAPIPPAQNPRGELIFSSRVSAAFREGYERYRGDWERRRTDGLKTDGRKLKWFPWGSGSGSGGGGSGSEKEKERERYASAESELGARRETQRGRSMSTASSAAGSRQSSPRRHRQSFSIASASSSTSSSPSPPPSRPSSPPHGDPKLFVAAEISGRIRAESFSALLSTMDEDGTDGTTGDG
ncbi:hypothetical protein RQP46_009418 [Phenoliferia psychrophenolica]